jgi:hypothetical protein
MMSIESIKKNLGVHADDYSEEELIIIRRDLYQLAYLAYNYYEKNILKIVK